MENVFYYRNWREELGERFVNSNEISSLFLIKITEILDFIIILKNDFHIFSQIRLLFCICVQYKYCHQSIQSF